MSDFTYESLTVVMRGGNVSGPRFLTVGLGPDNQNDPELLAAVAYIRRLLDEQIVAQRDKPATWFIG